MPESLEPGLPLDGQVTESVLSTGTQAQSTSDVASENTESGEAQHGAGEASGAVKPSPGAAQPFGSVGPTGSVKKVRSRVAGGTKPSYGTKDYKTVATKVSGALNAALEKRCRETGMTTSVLLRTALEKYLEGAVVKDLVSEVRGLADGMDATAREAAQAVARRNDTVKTEVSAQLGEIRGLVAGLGEQLSRLRVVQVQVLDEEDLDGALDLALSNSTELKSLKGA